MSNPRIREAVRREVIERAGIDGHGHGFASCRYCEFVGEVDARFGWVRLIGLEFDHVVPRAKGGTNDAANIVLACSYCNRSKKDKGLDEWRGGVYA